jgi:hypothetical protein
MIINLFIAFYALPCYVRACLRARGCLVTISIAKKFSIMLGQAHLGLCTFCCFGFLGLPLVDTHTWVRGLAKVG